ncbi:pyridoxamine 5'-phosphate oxidase family protein [Emticicia sp. BO119]|uniref:pyridoxamine 5'-phosphate oxidase family protein n=1 Tax=Emticicia sp. BO119 TaxID=2757768 RepID=UPI0015F0484C|nr:pyridoxamine 5'-phosphate oxidase family protein [Emticicia sp. BO119]MBA4850853.1 pyridoxamine 5'-phosphate oxidase family protein [Emticicia sp. BO119]
MYPVTPNTKISRSPKRGFYDEETIYQILDEGLFCHIAYVLDGQPMMIPTGYCRIGNKIYIHGSVGSHFMRSLADGRRVCLTVSFVDGLVLARSAFSHSVNYRSVVLFSPATVVTDEQERWDALEAFTNHVIPGRWEEIRQPNAKEMKGTMVIAFTIEEASAKVRTGGPNDDEEDYQLSVWAGVLPLKLQAQTPITDPKMVYETPVPDYVINYKK